MKIWFLVCIMLGLDVKAAIPSTPNHNFTERETVPSTSILSEMPSILEAYNTKAVLSFGEPCSYKTEMTFLANLVAKLDHADFSQSRDDDHDTIPVLFEREKLLHGMKQLIQNSDELCDYKKQLTCRKDNKCGYGSTSRITESEAGFTLDGRRCKSGLPAQSSCIISQDAQMSGSSSVADLTDLKNDSNSSYFTGQDKPEHDHLQIAAVQARRLESQSTSFIESARGQHVIHENLTSSPSLSPVGIYEAEIAPAAAAKINHKYSEFADSISTLTICTHFFLLTSSIIIMMLSFVLT